MSSRWWRWWRRGKREEPQPRPRLEDWVAASYLPDVRCPVCSSEAVIWMTGYCRFLTDGRTVKVGDPAAGLWVACCECLLTWKWRAFESSEA